MKENQLPAAGAMQIPDPTITDRSDRMRRAFDLSLLAVLRVSAPPW